MTRKRKSRQKRKPKQKRNETTETPMQKSMSASIRLLGDCFDKGLDYIIQKRKEREEAAREAAEVEKEEPKNKLPKWVGYDF